MGCDLARGGFGVQPNRASGSKPGPARWHSGSVNQSRTDDLAALVPTWHDWAACAQALGVSVSKVRQLIREHHLAAAVPEPGGGQCIPAELVADGQIVKGVPGVLTVLHDAGYEDPEIIVWLFTEDDSLPGRPVDALRENRGAEVKRRAQALGY